MYLSNVFNLIACLVLMSCAVLASPIKVHQIQACQKYQGTGGAVKHSLEPGKNGNYLGDNGYSATIWTKYNSEALILLTSGQNQLGRNGLSLAGKSVMNVFVEGQHAENAGILRYILNNHSTCLASVPLETFRTIWYEDVV